jgi:hypothetical protein
MRFFRTAGHVSIVGLLLALPAWAFAAPSPTEPPQNGTMDPSSLSKSGVAPCLGNAAPGIVESAGDVAPSRTDIRIVRVSPAGGANVGRSTVVVADLAYTVAEFEPGLYSVFAQFKTSDPGATEGGQYNGTVQVTEPAGILRICYPLASLWSIERISWPLSMWFYLGRKDGDSGTDVKAKTTAISFTAADAPIGAAQVQPPADSAEYARAIGITYSFFLTQADGMSACSDRFPDLAERIGHAYQLWEEAHSELQQQIDALFYERAVRQCDGNEGCADTIISTTRSKTDEYLAKIPDETLRQKCESVAWSYERGETDPEIRLRKELAIIRAERDAPKAPH